MANNSAESALVHYNSLRDPHLAGFFNNTPIRRHLKKTGVIDRKGEIVSEKTYRLNIARREHKQHVREFLAQAIVHKTLDIERNRQMEIRKKLEHTAKIDLVQRVRTEFGKRREENRLTLVRSRPKSGQSNSYTGRGQEKRGKRPKTAPTPKPPSTTMRKSSQPEVVIAVDRQGIPVTQELRSGSIKSKRDLYALNESNMKEYNRAQASVQHGYGRSPYLLSQPGLPAKSMDADFMEVMKMDHQGRSLVPSINMATLLLHPLEPPKKHRKPPQTQCHVTLRYIGTHLRLDYKNFWPRDDICVEQQHCGGNTRIFREKLAPGSEFTLESRRHQEYPFGLTFYINGVKDCRLSTCCEYKHSPGTKLWGERGHFGIVSVTGSAPCYKCQAPQVKKEKRNQTASKKKKHTTQKKELNISQGNVSEGTDAQDTNSIQTREAEFHSSHESVTERSDEQEKMQQADAEPSMNQETEEGNNEQENQTKETDLDTSKDNAKDPESAQEAENGEENEDHEVATEDAQR